jgi:uncharacterized protein YndB with AHSA1/START domain
MGQIKRIHEPESHKQIRQSVHVDCDIEDAFRLFTEAFDQWWPFADDCKIEPWRGGRLFETTAAGEETDLGSILVWDPPRRVEFTWHPGNSDDDDQTVTVAFGVEADGTRVTVTHQGWQHAGVEICSSAARFVCEQMLVVA